MILNVTGKAADQSVGGRDRCSVRGTWWLYSRDHGVV